MTEPDRTGLTQQLAEFVAGLHFSDIPAIVVHEAKRALIDHLGVALAASALPSVDAMVRVAVRCAGPGAHTVFGRRETVTMPYAALINGFSAHLLDYDDTFNPGDTTVHGSAPVWPAIAALAEWTRVTGPQALAAFVAGFETECRLGRAAGDAHYEIGWHVTGTVGHVGAAAAAGRVLGLAPAVLNQAMGSAGTQSAGLKAVYGTDGKPLHAGKAAMDGLLSAIMADEGITSSLKIVEDERGFLAVMSNDAAPEKLVEGFGEQWHLLDNGYKAYPSGSLTHPAIDAVLELRAAHGFAPDEVRAVRVRANAKAATVTGKVNPTTGLEAKFSITHGVAVALLARPRLDHYADESAGDPQIAELRDRVIVVSDGSVGKRSALLSVELADGRIFDYEVKDNKGTPGNPLSDADMAEKFVDNATPRLGADGAAELLARCWDLENLDDFEVLVRKLGVQG